MAGTINSFPVTTKGWADFALNTTPDDTDLIMGRSGASTSPMTLQTSKQAHGGIIPWTSGFPFKSGGYTDRNGTLYRAKQDHNGQDPELDITEVYWDNVQPKFASLTEAEEGTVSFNVMSPLRTHDALTRFGMASDLAWGALSSGNLNDHTNKGGIFLYLGSHTGAPDADNGNVLNMKGATASNQTWTQLAITRGGKMYFRESVGGTIGAWSEVVTNTSANYVTSSGSNANGEYRLWSDGFQEFNIKVGNLPANTTVTVNYPLTLTSKVIGAQLTAQSSGLVDDAAINFLTAPALSSVQVRNTGSSNRDDIFIKIEGY